MIVILAKEKHGDRIVRAEDGTLESAALELLTERLEEGYWYYDPAEDTHPFVVERRKRRDALLAFSEEQMAELPDEVQAARKRAEQEVGWEQRESEEFAKIQRAVAEGDGALAWRILLSRRDHEYEWVEEREI